MEKEKFIRLLYFWCDLYNFVIGLGLMMASRQGTSFNPYRWMMLFSGLAFSIINLVPTLSSFLWRSDNNYQV